MSRSWRRFGIAVLAAASCVGCAVSSRPGTQGPGVSPEAALVYVYLDVPGDSTLRSLRLEDAALVRGDGTLEPLPVLLAAVGRGRAGEARLVARGGVPAGSFDALALRVSSSGAGSGGPQDARPTRGDELRAPISLATRARGAVVIEARLVERPASTEGGASVRALEARVAPYPTFGVMGLVSSATDDAVVILDKRSGRVGAVARTGRSPAGLAIDAERRRGYVVTTKDDGVSILDLDQGAVTTTRALRMGDEPVAVEIVPGERSLLVVNRGSGTLAFVESEGLAESERVTIGGAPTDVAIDRQGVRAYVFNSLGSTVTVVDLRARQVVGTVAVDSGPIRGQLNRAQDRLWVLHDGVPVLTCIDTRTLAVVERLHLAATATALRLDPATDRIYVARRDGSGMDAYDPRLLLPVETLPLAGRAEYLGLDAETRVFGAALDGDDRVEAVGTIRKSRVWSADVRGPVFVRFVGER